MGDEEQALRWVCICMLWMWCKGVLKMSAEAEEACLVMGYVRGNCSSCMSYRHAARRNLAGERPYVTQGS